MPAARAENIKSNSQENLTPCVSERSRPVTLAFGTASQPVLGAPRAEAFHTSSDDAAGRTRGGSGDLRRQLRDVVKADPLSAAGTALALGAVTVMGGHAVVSAARRAQRRRRYPWIAYQSDRRGSEVHMAEMAPKDTWLMGENTISLGTSPLPATTRRGSSALRSARRTW